MKERYANWKSDFDYLNKWAKNIDINNYKTDPIGKIPNVGIATIQHLRMIFGVNTIKPDQRVKQVLKFEFGIEKLSDLKVIIAMEQIAKITNLDVLFLDQMFVKYGSGYYNQSTKETKIFVRVVAKRLKNLAVAPAIISKATLLTLEEIQNL